MVTVMETAAPAPLPWLAPTVARALAMPHAHALLLHGAAGDGLLECANTLVHAWLCEATDEPRPCGHCGACRLLAGGVHPDLHRLMPEALRQHRGVETAPAALVGKAGVGEAVADHGAAGGQGRLDLLHEVVTPRREDEQGLRQRIHGLVQHQLAQPLGQRRAARLARQHHVVATPAQPGHGAVEVRALAGAVDAFEGDEAAAAHGVPPRW